MAVGKAERERRVFEGVVSFCHAAGGVKRANANQFLGAIDADREEPDLAIEKQDGTVIALEHFRVDQLVHHNKTLNSKSAKTEADIEKRRKALKEEAADGIYAEAEEMIVQSVMQLHDAIRLSCCGDLARSLAARLFGPDTGHEQKLSRYRCNLASRYGAATNVQIGYLIEVHSDFRGLFLNRSNRVTPIAPGACPLFEDFYNLLKRAASSVDWIMMAFCPVIGTEIVDAAIIDCRNGRFSASCKRQGLDRTMLIGSEKDEPTFKRRRDTRGPLRVNGVWQVPNNTEPNGRPDIGFRAILQGASTAINCSRCGESFAATLPVQMCYEIALFDSKRFKGDMSVARIDRILRSMPAGQIGARAKRFAKKYGLEGAFEDTV